MKIDYKPSRLPSDNPWPKIKILVMLKFSMPYITTTKTCQALKNKVILLYHAKAINRVAVSLSSKIA
jgi:hypothetical protein